MTWKLQRKWAGAIDDRDLVPIIEKLTLRLIEGMDVDRIFLFGSQAVGEASHESDIDLLIVVEKSSVPAYRLSQRAYQCAGAVGRSKDLVVMTCQEFDKQCKVVNSLAYRVTKDGILIYDRGEAVRELEMADQEPA